MVRASIRCSLPAGLDEARPATLLIELLAPNCLRPASGKGPTARQGSLAGGKLGCRSGSAGVSGSPQPLQVERPLGAARIGDQDQHRIVPLQPSHIAHFRLAGSLAHAGLVLQSRGTYAELAARTLYMVGEASIGARRGDEPGLVTANHVSSLHGLHAERVHAFWFAH